MLFGLVRAVGAAGMRGADLRDAVAGHDGVEIVFGELFNIEVVDEVVVLADRGLVVAT